jgi:flagellar basal-body rod protein FlgG
MKALFTAATGMTAQQHQIDTIANNLANVSTNGFKKTRVAFEDLVYQSRRTGEISNDTQRPAQLEIGSGVRIMATNRDFGTGTVTHTGNPLDVAIAGRGFFVVETPDGEERYTRNGVFHVNMDGELVNQAGLQVNPGIEIPSDAMEVKIAEDGTVKAVYDVTRGEVTLGTLELVDFGNPNGLRALGGNVYMATPESGDPVTMESEDGISLKQGFVEGSNVDVAEELVAMIVAQRSFELTSKVVQAADETLQVVNNLKR